MDYRKFYQEQLEVIIPENFHIHHLDFNRENNDIRNLVAIPKILHQKYHYYLKQITCLEFSLNEILMVTEDLDHYTDFNRYYDLFSKIKPFYNEIKEWVKHRNVLPLLGKYQELLNKVSLSIKNKKNVNI